MSSLSLCILWLSSSKAARTSTEDSFFVMGVSVLVGDWDSVDLLSGEKYLCYIFRLFMCVRKRLVWFGVLFGKLILIMARSRISLNVW